MAPDEENEEPYIALIGKEGVGKSSTGKTLVGRDVFRSGVAASPVTSHCLCESTSIDGRTVNVVDSPGLTSSNAEETVSDVIKLSPPGLSAIIACIKIGRFTEFDQAFVDEALKLFGSKLARYLIVVFTGEDELIDNGETQASFIKSIPDSLKELLHLVDDRYLTVNNRAPDPTFRSRLLQLVDTNTIRNGGERYTELDFLQAKEERERKEKEEMQKEERNRKRKRDEIEKQVKTKYARLVDGVREVRAEVEEAERLGTEQTAANNDVIRQMKHRLQERRGSRDQWRSDFLLQIVRNEERKTTNEIAALRSRIAVSLRRKREELEVMRRRRDEERAAELEARWRREERRRQYEEEHRRRMAAIAAEIRKQQEAFQHRRAREHNEEEQMRRRNGDGT